MAPGGRRHSPPKRLHQLVHGCIVYTERAPRWLQFHFGQVVSNAEARFNNSLRPRKPEGSLGRTAQHVHLDSHTAPEL